MKIYHYDNKKVFIGSSDARIDPLETKLKKKNVHLIPANATKVKPPAIQENKAAVFSGEKWTLEDDYRGAIAHSIADNTEFFIADIGILPDDVILGNMPPKIDSPEEILEKEIAITAGDFPGWASDLFDLVNGTKTVEQLPELSAKASARKILRANKT